MRQIINRQNSDGIDGKGGAYGTSLTVSKQIGKHYNNEALKSIN